MCHCKGTIRFVSRDCLLFRFLLEFNLYSWWNVDLSVKGNHDYLLTYCYIVRCDTEDSVYRPAPPSTDADLLPWQLMVSRASDQVVKSSSVRFLALSAQRSRGKTLMVPCDTEYPAFVSERTIKETTGNIDCEGCTRYRRTHTVALLPKA